MKCRHETPVSQRCLRTAEIDPCCGYDKCKQFQPDYKTNADHIRSMTDEELINVIHCPMGFSMFRCVVPMPCGDCKREWLKRPYKEDA